MSFFPEGYQPGCCPCLKMWLSARGFLRKNRALSSGSESAALLDRMAGASCLGTFHGLLTLVKIRHRFKIMADRKGGYDDLTKVV
jgi:hypothetical protein